MYNRYHGTNPALTAAEDMYGREEAFAELEDHIRNRRSVVVMGVEGVGKSSLLNCYFNLKYRQKMASERRILIRVTDFPLDKDTDGIYQYLAEGVLHAVDALDQEPTQDIYKKLKEKCIGIMNECRDTASRFQQVCEIIQEYDYFIMLVIDGFERFVSSPQVKMEHHNLMNTLISKNLSFVVATNFDFNQDSLPETVSGSFLLMKFAGNEVKLKGLSEQSCSQLLDNGDFTPEEIHQMWILSGGIPALLRRAAEHAFLHKQDGNIVWMDILKETYSDVQPLLARWCKLLSANQVRVLNELANGDSKIGVSFEDAALDLAAKTLVDRGLLSNPIESGSLRTISGLYKFSTPILKYYCKENTLHAESISSFQAEQDAVRVKDALVSTLEDPEISEEKIIEMYMEIADSRKLPKPIDFNEELSDLVLQEYELRRGLFDQLDPEVRDFIANGIRVERTLAEIDLLDFSPSYISFAKAAEVHLNKTLVPVLKKISPHEIITVNGRSQDLCDSGHLMLGSIKNVLARSYSGTGGKFTANAGRFCLQNLGGFPETWWLSILKDIDKIKTTRNDMPHSKFLSGKDGKEFLKTLFGGDKCVFLRCQELFDTAVQKGIL